MREDGPVSRRRVLQTMGVGGAIALAGCLHDNDDDNCRDLTLDLTTGTTNGSVDSFGTPDPDWRVVSSPDGTTGQAVSIQPVSQWATVPTANWIDSNGTGGWPAPSDPIGDYVYEIDFQVGDTWSDDECELRIHQWAVDDDATLELDGPGGTTTLTQGSGFGSLMGPVTEPVGPGQYTLRARVGNNATITGLLIDADVFCECTDEPVDDSCELSITKEYAGEAPVAPGDSMPFEITVCNDGDTACQQSPVTVVDEIPTGTSFVGDSGSGWNCSETGGTVTCEHPNSNGLAAGDCLPTLTLELELGDEGYEDAIRNCATVEQGETAADNVTDCASVPVDTGECDLSISKSHDGDQITPETSTQFELTVCNDGDGRCDGPVTVIDSLPSGVSYDAGSGTGWTITATGSVVTCEHPNSNGLAAGDCLPPITLDVAVGSIDETGDQIVNCASLKVEDANTENNRDCITLPVVPVGDDCNLAITKRHDGDVVTAGENTTFEITVCNNGDGDCTDPVTVTDALPNGVTFVAESGTGWSCTENGGTVTCTHPNDDGLAFGECLPPLVVEVAVGSIDETGDQITNCAHLDGTDQDPNDDRDCVTVAVVESDTGCSGLNVEKAVGRRFRYGAQGTYEIEVCNYVEQTCNGAIEVTDTLAPGLTFVSHSGSGWNVSVAGSTVTATHANSGGLTAGQCLPVLTLTVAVDSASTFPGGSDGITNCAQVSADGTLVDEDCITHVITNE
jgi:uncharacterized repeat protein (TIGR01451 family)